MYLISVAIKSQSTAKLSMASKNTSLKRKAPSDDTSSEEDTPLALSPAKQSKSAAISMPGAIEATTVPMASVTSKRPRKSTKATIIESDDSAGDDAAFKSESDEPIAKKKPAKKRVTKAKTTAPKKKAKLESGDEEDTPVKPKKRAKKAAKVESDAESDEEEKPKARSKKKSAGKKPKDEDASSMMDVDSPQKAPKNGKGKKVKVKDDEAVNEEEAIYRWWEAKEAEGDNSVKWTTLEHNGVIFPPPYEPLPSHVKMKYNGMFWL